MEGKISGGDHLLRLAIHELDDKVIREWYYSKPGSDDELFPFSTKVQTFIYRFALILNNKLQISLCQENQIFKRAYDEYIVSDKVGDYEYFAKLFYKYS